MDVIIAGVLLCVLLSALFSASETVFLSYSRLHYKARQRNRRSQGFDPVEHLSSSPEKFVATTQIGNNLVNVAYSSFSALVLVGFGLKPIAILVLPPLFLLLFAEVIPKIVARQMADKLVLPTGYFITAARLLIWPVARVFEAGVSRVAGGRSEDQQRVFTRADITFALKADGESGVRKRRNRELLMRSLVVSEMRAMDVMTPRIAVVAVPESLSTSDISRMFATEGFSRMPVYRDNSEDIVGVIGAHDMLRVESDWREVIKPLTMVPESLKLVNLLPRMRQEKMSLVGVLDEYGGFAGIVTVEDVVEELVGPIGDEYDSEAELALPLSKTVWLAQGMAKLTHLESLLGISFGKRGSRSLGGFITEIAGRIPKAGEEVRTTEARFRVIRADPQGAELIRITVRLSAKRRSDA